MDKKEKLEEARKQLDALAKELGVYIGGCGCCGSPFLQSDDGHIDNVKIG